MKTLLLVLFIIYVGVKAQYPSGRYPGPPSPDLPSGRDQNTNARDLPHGSSSGPGAGKFFEILELVVFKECNTTDINVCLNRTDQCARSILLNGAPSPENMKSTFKDCVLELSMTSEQEPNEEVGKESFFQYTKEKKADLLACIMTKNGKFGPFVSCINGNVTRNQ